jgi:hypothetical protein
MTEKVTETSSNNPSLTELMAAGTAKPLDIKGQLTYLDRRPVIYSEGTERLISKTSDLSMEQIFAAVHDRGLPVSNLDVTASGATEYSTYSLDIDYENAKEKPVPTKPSVVHFGTYLGRARVIGSPGSNVVFVTTDSDAASSMRSALNDTELDGVKKWFWDKGFKIKASAPINFITTSVQVGYRTIALVFDSKQI